MDLHVVFVVAGSEYVIPASDVVQMESYAGATTLPNARADVAGLVQLRGRVVPVLDLRARFGLQRAESTLDSRLVVVQHGERVIALLADKAREVVRLAPGQLEPPPRMVAEQAGGLVRAVARVGTRLLLALDLEAVIGHGVVS